MFRSNHVFTSNKRTSLPILGEVRYSAVVPAVLGLMLLWPFGDSPKKVSMTPGKIDPSAHGTVAVKTGKNGNTQVNITTKALAQPSALTPQENTYVVWFQPEGKSPKDVGALKVDNHLNGKLVTTVPYRRFKVFITAEQQGDIDSPHGPQVLTADVLG